jgi:predicted phage terminase large subunit-like protein
MQPDDQGISGEELARRVLARRKLEHYIRYTDARFDPMPPHVPFICKELEDVVRYIETGEGTPILVLATPPRHLKTTIVADKLTEWFHGRNPTKKVMCTSHSGSLIEESSKRVRGMINHNPRFANLFGEKATTRIDAQGMAIPDVEVANDTRAADKWRIEGFGGEHHAVGVGGTLTGFGGHLIIVDDPLPGRAEAESQAFQNRSIEFFRSTLFTRREKNAAIVIIMQLWNDKDLVGWLKRVKDPEDPEYIANFPPVKFVYLRAIAEKDDPLGRSEGAALWPTERPVSELLAIKGALGEYYFNSQYQQKPTSPDGATFKRNFFPVVPRVPIAYKIQYWDTAEKKGQENDYWAGGTFGVTAYGILIPDIIYEKMTPDEGEEAIIRFFHQHNTEEEPVSVVWIEDKSSGPALIASIQAGEANIPIAASKVVGGDKIARANAIVHYCKARRVQLLQHSPWIPKFFDEMTAFPTGGHDDLPDMVVGGVSKLVHGGHVKMSNLQKIAAAQRPDEPQTGADYRREFFDGAARAAKGRGRALRQPPSSNPYR